MQTAFVLIISIYFVYQELHFHVEESLTRKLHVRCSSFVHQVIDATNHEIQGE